MIKTYIMWGLFLLVTVYMIYELFLGKKDEIEIPEPEPETDEDRKLAELAEKSALTDVFEDSIEEQELELLEKEPDPNRKLVRVFLAESQVQSRMIEMKLGEAGIEAIIEPTGTSLFPLDPDSGAAESILVDETDVKAAQDIIKEFIAQEGNPTTDRPQQASKDSTNEPKRSSTQDKKSGEGKK